MQFITEFHHPVQLPNPQPNYEKLLKTLHSEIGTEQLINRIEVISCEWALQSGYYFKATNNRFIFVHVTLNPRDFN